MLKPESVVVIGGNLASSVMANTLQFGFEGDIWHINPRNYSEDEFYDALNKLPVVPDSAYVAVPSEQTISVVKILAKIGVYGCVCYASGFAEMGEEGAELQNKLVKAAERMVILGPNCFGLIDYRIGLYFWLGEIPVKRKGKGIAIVSQSGAIAEFVAMQRREAPIVSIISVGNQANLSLEQIVDVILQDDAINTIGLVIEGIINVKFFAGVAKKAFDKRIPITVLKVGNSKIGSEIAKWHTGNLVTHSDLYGAYFSQLGILQVNSVEQFLETTKFLSMSGKLKSNKIASITVSGGQAAMIADKAIELGIEHPSFTEQQIKDLRSHLPKYANVINPLDITTDVMSNKQKLESICNILATGNAEAITMSVDAHNSVNAPFSTEVLSMLEALASAVQNSGKVGIVNSELQETMPDFVKKRAIALGLIPIQGLDQMLGTISNAAAFENIEYRSTSGKILNSGINPGKTKIESHHFLDEFESKVLVKEFGVFVPKGVKKNEKDLVEAARELGFPVALKLLSSKPLHKSESFGVVTNIHDEESLIRALGKIKLHNPTENTFLVEEMILDVVGELLVSISFDTTFGCYLTIGTGGIHAEILSDTATLILPVTRRTLLHSLGNLKCFPILSGYKNHTEGDIQSVVNTIENLIALVSQNPPGSLEVEINPLLILPRGRGAIASDVVIKRIMPS